MFARFYRWLTTPIQPQQDAQPPKVDRQSFFSTDIEVDEFTPRDMRLRNLSDKVFKTTVGDTRTFDDVRGIEHLQFAADSNNYQDSIKSIFALNQVGIPEVQANWYGSQGFIGYQLCALLAQNWLVNKACLVPARDAVRKGYKFTVNDGSDVKPEVIDAMTKMNKRFKLDKNLVEYVKMGRVFGIRIALFLVETDDPDYYVKPFNIDSVTRGTYKGISQIDPYWCVPELTSANASNPAAIDFYEPTYWIINGKRHHKSHLVVMRGPEVGDILKPSYLYGGLSVPQMIYERVYAAERTANEAPHLAMTKRAMVFYTDAAKALANQGAFEQRLAVWAAYRDNFGVKIADKEADQVEQHDTSLVDLDTVIMTQYQIVAAAANMPATKLLGTTPKGFNASGDYESESYHEELESIQTNDMEPLVDRHMQCLIRSEIAPRFGIEPFGVDCTWEPLQTLSDEQRANVNKVRADTDAVLVTTGALSGDEVRARVSADEHSGHNGLPLLDDQDDQDPTDEQA